MKEQRQLNKLPLFVYPPINSTQINRFPEGLHRVLLLMIEKVRLGYKKSEGNHPLTKSNQNNRNYVRVILMPQSYKFISDYQESL